jgi:hypothetical protein
MDRKSEAQAEARATSAESQKDRSQTAMLSGFPRSKTGIEKVSLEFTFSGWKSKMLTRNPLFTIRTAKFSAASDCSKRQLQKLSGKSVFPDRNPECRLEIRSSRLEIENAEWKSYFSA